MEDFKWAKFWKSQNDIKGIARFGDRLWDVAVKSSLDTYLSHVQEGDAYIFMDPAMKGDLLGKNFLASEILWWDGGVVEGGVKTKIRSLTMFPSMTPALFNSKTEGVDELPNTKYLLRSVSAAFGPGVR